jgi:hypothetical protein
MRPSLLLLLVLLLADLRAAWAPGRAEPGGLVELAWDTIHT